ncbi:hypothetical protein ACP6PL_01430 [Dapis sp. BLCC M126]|uniref:hypothetical protein n=1 Tax=Dapis sp. BLCC M126 TaxID=3400189 RepID=UPI003CF6FB45
MTLRNGRSLSGHWGFYTLVIFAGEWFCPRPNKLFPGLLCCGDSTFMGIGLPAVRVWWNNSNKYSCYCVLY